MTVISNSDYSVSTDKIQEYIEQQRKKFLSGTYLEEILMASFTEGIGKFLKSAAEFSNCLQDSEAEIFMNNCKDEIEHYFNSLNERVLDAKKS